jgi:hypothetical protein
MPNRAKHAAVRQSQLGQRRRKERKGQAPLTQQAGGNLLAKSPPNNVTTSNTPTDIQTPVVTSPATSPSSFGSSPSRAYLRSDLTRIGIVTLLSMTIVISGAVIL